VTPRETPRSYALRIAAANIRAAREYDAETDPDHAESSAVFAGHAWASAVCWLLKAAELPGEVSP